MLAESGKKLSGTIFHEPVFQGEPAGFYRDVDGRAMQEQLPKRSTRMCGVIELGTADFQSNLTNTPQHSGISNNN